MWFVLRLRNDTLALGYGVDFAMGTRMPRSPKPPPMNFKSLRTADVPRGRRGKHKDLVTRILSDLDQIDRGVAIKVPLDALPQGKANVRSALNRAARQHDRTIVTASDDTYLYIWDEKA